MQINSLTKDQFVKEFGGIFEYSPWVAERAWELRPFQSLADLGIRMTQVVAQATETEQLALLRAHPDLGTRARVSSSSAAEQAGVGLNQLSPDELKALTALNSQYTHRFGFPFIYAVKGSDKFQIIGALKARLESGRESEFQTALEQVYRIAGFRLQEIEL